MKNKQQQGQQRSGTKRDSSVTVWLQADEIEKLDEKIARKVRVCPGAVLSRSAYLAELLRRDLAAQES